MLAPGAMAVFALNVGQVGQLRIIGLHTGPVAIGQHRWEHPVRLGSEIVKPSVHCPGICVVTNRMANDAVLAACLHPKPAPFRLVSH